MEKNSIFKLGLILFVITAVTGAILGAVHEVTSEPIRATQERLRQEALKATLPAADTFSSVPLAAEGEGVLEVSEGTKDGQTVGYNLTVKPKGYAGPIELIVGISREGLITGIKILNQSETPGLGANATLPSFSGQFAEKKAQELSVTKSPPQSDAEIQAISGATITSTAVTSGVNNAVKYWKAHFSGGNAQ